MVKYITGLAVTISHGNLGMEPRLYLHNNIPHPPIYVFYINSTILIENILCHD
jgi:hypothetical protein